LGSGIVDDIFYKKIVLLKFHFFIVSKFVLKRIFRVPYAVSLRQVKSTTARYAVNRIYTLEDRDRIYFSSYSCGTVCI